MPVGVGKMSPAKPQAAALAILLSTLAAGFVHARDSLAELFFGFHGCCVHIILQTQSANSIAERDLVAENMSLAGPCAAYQRFASVVHKRASYNGSIEASQASDVGSIPIARSRKTPSFRRAGYRIVLHFTISSKSCVGTRGHLSQIGTAGLVPGPGLEPGYSAPKADVLPIRRSRNR
jgi:hypothetical protein